MLSLNKLQNMAANTDEGVVSLDYRSVDNFASDHRLLFGDDTKMKWLGWDGGGRGVWVMVFNATFNNISVI